MGPSTAVHERQRWADYPVNGGYYSVLRGANDETLTGFAARRAGKANEMRKYLTFRLNVNVKVDLAACLRATAVLVYLFT
jgi:uncharacterized protein (UPF0262 family)